MLYKKICNYRTCLQLDIGQLIRNRLNPTHSLFVILHSSCIWLKIWSGKITRQYIIFWTFSIHRIYLCSRATAVLDLNCSKSKDISWDLFIIRSSLFKDFKARGVKKFLEAVTRKVKILQITSSLKPLSNQEKMPVM